MFIDGFYEVLIVIVNFINNFYAELSLSKKIFFFKELNHNNLNINKYSNRINELVLKTNPNIKTKKFHNNFFQGESIILLQTFLQIMQKFMNMKKIQEEVAQRNQFPILKS